MAEIFTIVAPDFEGSISEFKRQRFIDCLLSQSLPSWRLLLIHDGPRAAPIEYPLDPRVECVSTDERANDWGHTQRALGISLARGRYIWVVNPDNVLYRHSLAIAHAYSMHDKKQYGYRVGTHSPQVYCENPDVLICAVRMMGLVSMGHTGGHVRMRGDERKNQLIFPGWPPRKFGVDAMSLIAKSEIYKEIGWPFRHEDSDGDIIQAITEQYGYLLIPEILGEHW